MSAAQVLGVDGVRGSWVAVRVLGDPASAQVVHWGHGRFADLVDDRDEVVAVDVPVGVLPSGRRDADQAGRAALGGAASRLFLVPPGPALTQPDMTAANRWLAAHGELGVSVQCFGLRHAISEVWAVAGADPRVCEVHPELSFLAATGRVLARKRSAVGVGQRLRALAAWTDIAAALAAAPAGVPVDDALDALAAAWSATRICAGLAVRYPAGATQRPLIQA